ncbi:response regulator [Pseudidiomarina insulisalsae]|uniref:DNA-binding response regulator n=1 Tax=Pseudidiomarina insulisalsae TaxID=575789 RepID=A0A432YAF6_9GAMM|nr:response regulator transcription factor [Pseudidiomarina insulisalsae]RUO57891.1 DNA-binding response regulator [Pseudidiomarina insulisalsae]
MKHSKAKCLIIEDEPRIRAFIRISLQAEGFEVFETATFATALEMFQHLDCDLIILDLGLPDGDGQDLIHSLRKAKGTPILVLSARDDEEEKVRALEAGANDYLTKPFGIRELLARLKVLIRDNTNVHPIETRQALLFHDFSIDYSQHKVVLGSRTIKLSPKEFELLWLLASNHQRLIPQKDILTRVWGPQHKQDLHYLRIFISQLRRKLGDDSREPQFIETLPGVGYRFLLAPQR